MSTSVFQNSLPSLWFGIVTALIAIGAVVASVVLALRGEPFLACFVLGTGCCGLAAMRLLWPGRPWFASRNRWADSAVYAAIGAALIFLAPWANALPA